MARRSPSGGLGRHCGIQERALAKYGSISDMHFLLHRRAGRIPPPGPFKGFGGAAVLEIMTSLRGNTWRAIHTVRFHGAVYVLHVFQGKSTKVIAKPAREMNLVRQRLAEAEREYRERQN